MAISRKSTLGTIKVDLMANFAIFAIMPSAQDIHSLHTSRELPTSPSTDLKNTFKSVFQKALESGPVSITRNRKREAILLSADLYDQIIKELASRDPLEILRKDYDKRFAAMQNPEAAVAYEDAFNCAPKELGKVAAKRALSE